MKKRLTIVALVVAFVAVMFMGIMVDHWTGLKIGFLAVPAGAAILFGLVAYIDPEFVKFEARD